MHNKVSWVVGSF